MRCTLLADPRKNEFYASAGGVAGQVVEEASDAPAEDRYGIHGRVLDEGPR